MLGLLAAGATHAQKKELAIEPVPAWVVPHTPDLAAGIPDDKARDGMHVLLSDVQTRVSGDDRATYRHVALKALNARGVEHAANIELRFFPAFQTIAVHAINVIRDGRVLPKLNLASIRVLQREWELEYRILDGSKTAHVFLDDVRAGDVVEYAYTLSGANPVFGGRQFGRVELQWSVPVHRAHRRLLWPADRKLHIVHRNTSLRPVVTQAGGFRDHRWDMRDPAPLLVEAGAPQWFDPYGSVQWSEFEDWKAVARWAVPLYRVPEPLGPRVHEEINRIARKSTDPGARLLDVLRFVQGEIRYLGIEIGASSHAPSPPDVVLDRRFGDCKDKSLLTVAMLRALGIAAHPALVNTVTRMRIPEQQASPDAFDHVIVRARIGDRDYWLDPTRGAQQGTLATLYQPNFGHALMVAPDTTGLTKIGERESGVHRKSIYSVIDSGPIDEPVRFEVRSVFDGASAELMRQTLEGNNLESMQKQYLNFYVRHYPGITADGPIDVKDDAAGNRLTMTERYRIPGFWKRQESQPRRAADLIAPEVSEYLAQPREPVRSSPLALAHPVDVSHTTEVRLPDAWSIRPEREAIDDPAFEFEHRVSANARTLYVSSRYKSRLDHVAAADTTRYLEKLARARNTMTSTLYRGEHARGSVPDVVARFNWPIGLLGAASLALCIWLALRIHRYDPPARDAAPDPNLQGIGGWLLLPALGLLVTPFRIAYEAFTTLPAYATDSWASLTTPGAADYHPLWAPLLLYELVANIALLVFSIVVLVTFVQKRTSAPRLAIAMMVASVLVQIFDVAIGSFIPQAAEAMDSKTWRELTRSVAALAIWGSYFHVSRRVRLTFVRRRTEPAPPVQEAVGA